MLEWQRRWKLKADTKSFAQHCGAVVFLEETNASSSVRRLIELIFCITIIYNMLLDLMFMKLKLYSAHPIMFSYSHGGFYEKEY